MDTMPTIEDHPRGRPQSVAEMFSQILSTAQDRGHVDVEVIAKDVVLHGSRRILLAPDEEFLGWVRKACDVGQGAASRLSRSGGPVPLPGEDGGLGVLAHLYDLAPGIPPL